MQIYLACTVRGDRVATSALRGLADALESEGHIILTRHLLQDDVDRTESALNEKYVYERDMKWLDACDVLVADASGSSFGVGFEVGYVLGRSDRTRQRVLLLYRAERRNVISRLIAGNGHPRCTVLPYATEAELVAAVKSAVGERD